MIALALLWLACGGAPDPVAAALRPAPDLDACAALAFPDLADPCRVEVAARAAGEGEAEGAARACGATADATWGDECWFQVAEGLARAGRPSPALAACGRAGRFAGPCVGHLAWGQGLQGVPLPALEAAAREGLAPLGEPAAARGVEVLLAGRLLHATLGSGRADPRDARAAGPALAPHARTAYAAEAVRLALAAGLKPDAAVARVLAAWRGEAPALEGPPRPPRGRAGRKARPARAPALCALPHAPTFGGGERLVGESPDEDVEIAALEGLFLSPEVPGPAFVPWLDDPRPRVRWTAARLFVLAGGLQVLPGALDALADPVQRELATLPTCEDTPP